MRKSHKLFTNCPFEVETKSEIIGNYIPQEGIGSKPVDVNVTETGFATSNNSKDIFKAFIPWFLYKPPYGFPRESNPLQLRQFAKNPYIFSVKKAIADQVCSLPFDIVKREEYETEIDQEARKQIIGFFDNPNGNDESFEHILRCWVDDVCDIGNFVGVKVFNQKGQFTQLFARDSSTFLMNTDIHGYLGNRADFVAPITQFALTEGISKDIINQIDNAKDKTQIDKLHHSIKNPSYDALYNESAAYFQYGWTAGARPVPFGKREIIWGGINPRTNSIYHRSPIEILYNQILTLVYGSEYNLDFYLNNNLPNGLLTLKGATSDQATMYRNQLQNQFMTEDEFGNFKKKHFKIPITGYEAEFTQMQMSSKEMEVIEQQKWFTKLVWSVFGMTSSEMGFTEDSSRATDLNQSEVSYRRAIKPFIRMFEYYINLQLMPEFGHPELEFKFIDYDIAEEKTKMDLYEQKLRMGIITPEQICKEMGMEYNPKDESNNENDFENESNKDLNEETSLIEELLTKSTNLEKITLERLKHLKKKILDDFSYKIELKGYIDHKSETKDKLSKYLNTFNDDQYKEFLTKEMLREFQKGIEKIEKLTNRNILVSTQLDLEEINFTLDNIKGLNTDLIENLRKQITMSLINKEPISKIRQKIVEQFNLAENRAKLIVQTETNRIFGIANQVAAEQSGVELYKYVNVHLDNRTSKICRDLHKRYGDRSQAIPLTEKFKLIDGREELTNGFHIGCRTTCIYIPKDEIEVKHKYIKRTGTSGNFVYTYPDDLKKNKISEYTENELIVDTREKLKDEVNSQLSKGKLDLNIMNDFLSSQFKDKFKSSDKEKQNLTKAVLFLKTFQDEIKDVFEKEPSHRADIFGEIRENLGFSFITDDLAEENDLFLEEEILRIVSDIFEDKKTANEVLNYLGVRQKIKIAGTRTKKTKLELEKDLVSLDVGLDISRSKGYVKKFKMFKDEKEFDTFVKDTIDKLPPKAKEIIKQDVKIRFLGRDETKTIRGVSRPNAAGFFILNTSEIYIYPPKEGSRTFKVDDYKEEYSAATFEALKYYSGKTLFEQTILHEMSHAVALLSKEGTDLQYSFDRQSMKWHSEDYIDRMKIMEKLSSEERITRKNPHNYISRYAETTSQEDFAETLSYYLKNRDIIDMELEKETSSLFSKVLLKKFNFMKENLWK